MTRPVTAIFAALEAVLVAGIGLGIPLVPLTLLWALQYGLQVDWLVFWRAAADIWLLGSGVDVTFTLDPATVAKLGVAGAGVPIVITIALLGFALLTVLLGARAGRRIGETPHARLGALVSVLVFAAISFGVTMSALYASARPSIWQGTLLPTLVFAIGVLIGVLWSRGSVTVQRVTDGWRHDVHAVLASGVRAGVAATAATAAVAAVIAAVLIAGSYAKIITLYEASHAGVLGGVSLTLGQLALLPNAVVWAMSWLVGPGFAIGSGSSVSPLGTELGPLPGVPLLGALPGGDLGWGFLGLAVPVLAGFLAAALIRSRLVDELDEHGRLPRLVAAGLLAGVVGGILLGLLAWASAGSAGPGRLVDVGPSPWAVGGWGALEIGVAAVVGMLAGRRDTDRLSPPR